MKIITDITNNMQPSKPCFKLRINKGCFDVALVSDLVEPLTPQITEDMSPLEKKVRRQAQQAFSDGKFHINNKAIIGLVWNDVSNDVLEFLSLYMTNKHPLKTNMGKWYKYGALKMENRASEVAPHIVKVWDYIQKHKIEQDRELKEKHMDNGLKLLTFLYTKYQNHFGPIEKPRRRFRRRR